jgi:hypothetical protein
VQLLAKSTSAEAAFAVLRRHAREDGGCIYWGKEPVPLPAQRLENQRPFLLPRLPNPFDATNVDAYALCNEIRDHHVLKSASQVQNSTQRERKRDIE